MIKRNELRTHSSCLNRAHDDEPLFVLRANDELAPKVVEMWANLYGFYKSENSEGMTDEQENKMMEARQLAKDMREWRRRNRA